MKKTDMPATFSDDLLVEVSQIIEKARFKVAFFLNFETTLMYWSIGNNINTNLKNNNRTDYGSKIIATLSLQLTKKYGKGYSYSALTRMCKVANALGEQNIATVSQQLSWSHLIELSTISDSLKREYYMLLAAQNQWGVRELREQINKMLYERTALAKLPENEIRKQLQTLSNSKQYKS